MATRKGHVPGGPLSGSLTPTATGAVRVPEGKPDLSGGTVPGVPPATGKSAKHRSLADYGGGVPRKPREPKDSGPNSDDLRLNWARMEPAKAGKRIWQMVEASERSLSWRHYMTLRGAAAYSGIGLGDLFENLSPYDGPAGRPLQGRKGRQAFQYGGWQNRNAEQHARAAAETVSEKLFGLDEPKTQRVATDVEWELRRQGIWADRWNEGNMHLEQGSFLDTWDLARQGALLAFVATGTVAARVEPDYVGKRVRTQLRSTLNTFIDPGDVANGMPLSYFDVTWENPEYMCEDPRFNAAQRDAIWRASEVPPQHNQGNYDGATFGTRMVKLASSWRMPFGDPESGFKGRQSLCVKGAPPILWETWDRPCPPLSFFRVNRCLGETFWAENFIEIMLDPLADAADIDEMAKESMRLTSQVNITLDGTSSAAASMLNAKTVNIHRYSSKLGEQAPQITMAQILADQYFQWRDRKIAVAQELSGVPSMHLGSQSPSHLQSGRAIRLEASMLPERFARKLRNWRHWVAVEIANEQVRAAREIGKVVPDWQVTWKGADFDGKVSVKVLDVDDTVYELRPYAVSELKGTPAERAEYAQELLDRKQITPDQHAIIVEGLYDTPKETKTLSAQRKYIAKTVDDMLHADPSVVEDENEYMATRYTPPMPWTDPGAAMAQVLPLYYQAVIDDVPQNRRDLVKRLIEDLLAVKMTNDRQKAMANASVSMKTTPEQAFPAPQAGAPMPAPLPDAPAPMDMGIGAPEAVQNVGGPPGIA